MLAFGAASAIYGAALPEIETTYGVGSGASGLLLSTLFAGAFAGIVISGFVAGRVGPRLQIGAAGLLLATGCALAAIAETWPLALTGAAGVGLGQGGLDVGLNNAFPRRLGHRAPALLNVLHACFGVGAILGPAGIAIFPDGAFRELLWACAAIALVATPFALAIAGAATGATATPPMHGGALSARLAGFAALFVLYVAIEAGIGGWTATYLVDGFGRSESAGAAATAAFWTAFTAGRFAAAALATRMAPGRLVVLGLCGGLVALCGAPFEALAPVALPLAGFCIAPVFPTGIAWIHRELPEADRATAVVIAASALGGVFGPLGMGLLIEGAGARSFPVVLLILAAGAVVTAIAVRRQRAAPAHLSAMAE